MRYTLGVAPRCCRKSRRKCREPTPSRNANVSTPPSPRPLSAMSRKPRETVFGVPSQAGVPGGHSGRQRAGPESGLGRGRGGRVVTQRFSHARSARDISTGSKGGWSPPR